MTTTTSTPVSVRARVRQALADTPNLTITEISAATGLRPGLVKVALDDIPQAKHDGRLPWADRRWTLWRT